MMIRVWLVGAGVRCRARAVGKRGGWRDVRRAGRKSGGAVVGSGGAVGAAGVG